MAAVTVLALALVATACAGQERDRRTAVASFYPLAYAAERIAGPGWEVVDLTPPGAEAHDVELSLENRSALERADLVIYLGDLGFQPQVEEAVGDLAATVVAGARGVHLREGEDDFAGDEHGHDEDADPHAWLDPVRFASIVDRVAEGFADADPAHESDYRDRAEDLRDELEGLDRRFRDGLTGCAHDTLVVSHEAFGYLADRYGLHQDGLAGLSPEAEPTAERLQEALGLFRDGHAGAVFFEQGSEAERIARSVAGDGGVPALPLSTLESRPESGDYLTVMEDNLDSLREGLACE